MRIARAARRLLGGPGIRSEIGGASVEFVILLPVFLALFLSSFEASMLLMRQVMLERGVDLAVREVRLGSNPVTQADLGRAICARARVLPECEANLLVEMRVIDQTAWNIPATPEPCIRAATAIQPLAAFDGTSANQLVLLRACFRVKPFVPGVPLSARTVSDEDGMLRIVASTAFVVEPDAGG
jgi:Flp pilus assembly protein TadG